jgi:hypothetical protein
VPTVNGEPAYWNSPGDMSGPMRQISSYSILEDRSRATASWGLILLEYHGFMSVARRVVNGMEDPWTVVRSSRGGG